MPTYGREKIPGEEDLLDTVLSETRKGRKMNGFPETILPATKARVLEHGGTGAHEGPAVLVATDGSEIMITGDHPLTARAIATELGIADAGTEGEAGRILTGRDFAGMGEGELKNLVEEVPVYARVSPEYKLDIVDALQEEGHIVAMTGDGVNDAPALRKADIGVARGITGTDVSKEASDMVLTDDNFATIVAAVEQGRVIYDNIRKFIKYLLTSNSAEILVMLVGPFLGLPLPLPLQILWINLVTDGPPALALSAEPAERDTMRRPPSRRERLRPQPGPPRPLGRGANGAGVAGRRYLLLADGARDLADHSLHHPHPLPDEPRHGHPLRRRIALEGRFALEYAATRGGRLHVRAAAFRDLRSLLSGFSGYRGVARSRSRHRPEHDHLLGRGDQEVTGPEEGLSPGGSSGGFRAMRRPANRLGARIRLATRKPDESAQHLNEATPPRQESTQEQTLIAALFIVRKRGVREVRHARRDRTHAARHLGWCVAGRGSLRELLDHAVGMPKQHIMPNKKSIYLIYC
jgi:hypothetical protein